MTRNVLVVGGAGYVGSHIAKTLARSGYTPVVFDNLSTGHRHAVKWGPLVEADMRDREAVIGAIKEHRPAAVLHFAALSLVGEGERQPARYYENNVQGTLTLVRAMLDSGVTKLVFSSTCAVYGATDGGPLNETQPKRPASVYGRSKSMAEDMLIDIARETDLSVNMLRYFNASGADPEGEIGEEHDPETHLIPNALKAAVGIGAGLNVFGDDYPTPDGTCIRDYIHVNDLADAHVRALERLNGGAHAYNLGVGTGCSVHEVLKAVEDATGRKVPFTIAPRRDGDPPALVADCTKSREGLGWIASQSSIGEIVSTAWNFHRTRWSLPETSR